MNYKEKYNVWINSDFINEETKNELKSISDEKEIEDRFYQDLDFGTGGLRGVIGAGSNRMNIYTVAQSTQGFANYLNDNFKDPSVAIAYDSRNMSKEFAKAAALNLCANNIKVYLYESLRPTPVLSFTVRELKCNGGIVITASHNPKIYNGYKVYDEFGGQVTDEKAKMIINSVKAVDDFSKIESIDENVALDKGLLKYIGEDVDKVYYEKVKGLTIRTDLVKEKASNLNVIYTPIHGSGNVPVRTVLKELGYSNVKVVKEQEAPDGNFPTASYPNPENPDVFELALKMAKTENPDIIFGTDPDCDRIGLVVKDSTGEYKVLTGNQTGLLLTNYILSSMKETNKLPQNGVVIKTIVTTEGARSIAEDFDIELMDVLTGFKYIGEKIREFEDAGDRNYIFGFEESYGYLAGNFVRDKDAVIAAMLVCEMCLYYKEQGKSLYDALIDLYEKYGYFKETLVSLELKGKEGQEKIANCIEALRNNPASEVNGVKIVTRLDYKLSVEENTVNNTKAPIDLPKSNVLKYILEDGSYFVVRPSGTEPKMKVYLAVKSNSLDNAEKDIATFKEKVMEIINSQLS
ncbi:phospho-sugar mutase [Clostridium beijerinckii]|jgi:alpha-phosphoglucomutase (EC 5.4.2.2)|uniref:phosphoglucomutase (alpha-D-glucose-1,6-bisphosphate-dependent) n=2 Tax=Clostridium beijerinckii TaxID=1520 RepID=A0AAE2RPE5_CLOBE|nr:phospho-sugar mutase [Clostridium beijerinckii]ABR33167.1 phosphoglucomutase/phosphomannomutase alpha/beta/alpha domain I [Clostridium beijerinckii NCIMB 8052]AIU03109.1 phosphoglucomutase/phosphomannomutase alpha/beta/subunit [Clostridium beijerinckii ATCC 35702]MBF7807153.1 phospho-sugar mutase [Clostridium beijerinckii]NOW93020.1 phosphoglucomutase [Clostridium beijerinckii]NRT25586.1 phosphoglucomutase [Clostridium beijerinckii]